MSRSLVQAALGLLILASAARPEADPPNIVVI